MTDRWKKLSKREHEVAVRIAAGMDRCEIAAALGIDPKTFDTHRSHVMQKLAVGNSVQLARLAIADGVVGLDEDPHAAIACDPDGGAL